MQKNANYFVHTNKINALSIYKGLQLLDINLNYIGKYFGFISKSRLQIDNGDFIFFTEEKTLKSFLNDQTHNFNYLPKYDKNDIIDNKLNFALYLSSINELPIPYCEINENNLIYPIIIKSKYSWKNNNKMPRGYIVTNPKMEKIVLDKIQKKYSLQDFFKQKFIVSTEDVISISGFFDFENERRTILKMTKKIIGDSDKLSTGIVIKSEEMNPNLSLRTKKLLQTMEYQGPFELEFIYDDEINDYRIIELNQRFWKQHSFFIEFYNNSIIKLYLDKNHLLNENEINDYIPFIWIDWISLIIVFFKFNIIRIVSIISSMHRILNSYKDTKIIKTPNIFHFKNFILK